MVVQDQAILWMNLTPFGHKAGCRCGSRSAGAGDTFRRWYTGGSQGLEGRLGYSLSASEQQRCGTGCLSDLGVDTKCSRHHEPWCADRNVMRRIVWPLIYNGDMSCVSLPHLGCVFMRRSLMSQSRVSCPSKSHCGSGASRRLARMGFAKQLSWALSTLGRRSSRRSHWRLIGHLDRRKPSPVIPQRHYSMWFDYFGRGCIGGHYCFVFSPVHAADRDAAADVGQSGGPHAALPARTCGLARASGQGMWTLGAEPEHVFSATVAYVLHQRVLDIYTISMSPQAYRHASKVC